MKWKWIRDKQHQVGNGSGLLEVGNIHQILKENENLSLGSVEMKGWWSLGVVEVRNIQLFTNHKEGFELVHIRISKEGEP